MFARVSTYQVSAEQIWEAEEAFGQAIDRIRDLDGLAAAYLLVDRESGRTMTMTVWDTRAAMEASRVTASRLRTDAARSVDTSVLSTEEFEVSARGFGA